MMAKPGLILYLKRNSLDFYNAEAVMSQRLHFPSEIVSNQEVINSTGLQDLIALTIKDLKLTQQPVHLVLADEVLFHKVIITNTKEDADKEIANFTDQVPFPPEKIITKTVTMDRNVIIYAINGEIPKIIHRTLNNLNWQNQFHGPIAFIGGASGLDQLNLKDINSVLNPGQETGIIDFAPHQEMAAALNPKVEPNSPPPTSRKKLLLPIILMAVLTTLIIVLGAYFFKDRLFTPKQTVVDDEPTAAAPPPVAPPTATTSAQTATSSASLDNNDATPSAIPATASAQIDRSQIFTRLIDGSGNSTSSAKLRQTLTALGYSSFTNSASTSTHSGTIVTFASDIPTPNQSEIASELTKLFTEVQLVTNPNLAAKNVVINLGTAK